uniref:Uncharacterized protein n=1 Tax=uncultured marine virus TaxID=186617 RepID=A0A0F7L0Y5_9VIRU|nr:hypothetical protein [uncultured marine virus]
MPNIFYITSNFAIIVLGITSFYCLKCAAVYFIAVIAVNTLKSFACFYTHSFQST